MFSLSSSGSSTLTFTEGDAGIVLRRVLLVGAPAPTFLAVEDVNGFDRVVAGVAGVRAVLEATFSLLLAVGLVVF